MYHLMYNSTKFKGPMVLGPNSRVLWFQQLSKHVIQFEIVILTKIVPLSRGQTYLVGDHKMSENPIKFQHR